MVGLIADAQPQVTCSCWALALRRRTTCWRRKRRRALLSCPTLRTLWTWVRYAVTLLQSSCLVTSLGLCAELSKDDEYKGVCTITATLAASLPEDGVFLDFTGNRITELLVNGAAVTPASGNAVWKEHKLTLKAAVLRAGEQNTIKVTYTNEYDHTGVGLHSFKDPEDGEVYLYTNFEPFDGHRLFPCFDQPDLKGALTLAVLAPGDWHVIGNGAVLSKDPVDVSVCLHGVVAFAVVSVALQ